jgi:hypothetical protein
LDIAPHLVIGDNIICATVRAYCRPMPWWRPARPAGDLGRGAFAFEAPAIDVFSDETWRGVESRQRLGEPSPNPHAPLPELVDGDSEPPSCWLDHAFDDSTWVEATILAGSPIEREPRSIPGPPITMTEDGGIAPRTAIPLALREVAPSTYDAGRITIGTLAIKASGPRGSAVELTAGEDLREDGSVEAAPRHFRFTYALAGGASPERYETFDAVGFRYVSVATRGGAVVEQVAATERRYPTSPGAAFECDDAGLESIWRIGARTLEVCATDAFIDCPGREQNAWLGDSYIHCLLSFVTNADWRLVRRHLALCAQTQRADGFLPMIAASDPGGTLACTEYGLHWARAVARYHEYSGDAGLVRTLIPVAIRLLDAFEAYRGRGDLLRGVPGVFVDWSMIDRNEVTGVVDALYAATLDDVATLVEEALGWVELAAELRARAGSTRRAFDHLWDEARGLYVDAAGATGPRRRVSQHTNALAIVSGCAPKERWPGILERILDPGRVRLTPNPTELDPQPAWRALYVDPSEVMAFNSEVDIVMAQPFFSHFVHQAVAVAGQRARVPELCRRWLPQVERGNTTFEEFWTARPGAASRAHAWSATPVYDLTTHVLGVRPLAPGFAKAGISPLFGRLRQLGGKVPTPRGFIELSLTREGGEVTVPPRTTAVLTFEDCDLDDRELGPGRHRLGGGAN